MTVAVLESLDLWYMGAELTLVLVLLEDDREKVMLAFVETVRCDCCDCCDIADVDRCRTRVLYCFLEWDAARCGTAGTAGTSGRGAGAVGVCWLGTVKKQERWFGCGDMDRLGDDSTSGLVGGVVPVVTALSDMSSSDLWEDPVEDADMGWMSGALYESMFVV